MFHFSIKDRTNVFLYARVIEKGETMNRQINVYRYAR